jgi:hypothetical protein
MYIGSSTELRKIESKRIGVGGMVAGRSSVREREREKARIAS